MKIYNYVDEERIYETNGIKYKHLGTIYWKERTFIVYQINFNTPEAITFIEELISNKISDNLFGQNNLIYIEDETEWLTLVQIAQKENILSKQKALSPQ